MYYKARLPKEQKNSVDKIFSKEENIFDVQKVGANAIINAVDKELIQAGVDCEGRIYYLFDNEIMKIDYEINFSSKNIKVYIDSLEDDTEDKLIIQHYLDMFINALVDAHTGSFECELINTSKPKKLVIKEVQEEQPIKRSLSVESNEDTIEESGVSLIEKSTRINEINSDNQISEEENGENDKMINLSKIYEEIEKESNENTTLNLKVYFENNCFGVTVETNENLIANFIISNKEYYTRKEKIDSLVSSFETVNFIEKQVSNLTGKTIEFKKFFVMDQEIDENIGCPSDYIGFWNKNGNYVAM